MGLYDTFIASSPVSCPAGHGRFLDFQTKALDCCLNYYRIGDEISISRFIKINDACIWTYTYCTDCDKIIGRWAHIHMDVFTGFCSDVMYEDDITD